MEDYVVGGVPTSGVILGLVQIAKDNGLPTRFAMPLAVAIGVTLYATWSAVKGATPEQWWVGTVMGVMAGLAASGAYSGVKKIRE